MVSFSVIFGFRHLNVNNKKQNNLLFSKIRLLLRLNHFTWPQKKKKRLILGTSEIGVWRDSVIAVIDSSLFGAVIIL